MVEEKLGRVSSAGNNVTSPRNWMDPENVENIIKVNLNLQLLREIGRLKFGNISMHLCLAFISYAKSTNTKTIQGNLIYIDVFLRLKYVYVKANVFNKPNK